MNPENSWSPASPADSGMDAEALSEVDRRIVADFRTVSCLLVARHGRLVFERYYGGNDEHTFFDVRSITKSIVSTVVGITVGDGRLSLSGSLRELLPALLPQAAESRLGAITVEHLLTMTAGFAWDDLGDWGRLWASENWLDTILRTPLASDPGRTFAYNGGCSQLLSAIVGRVTGHRLADITALRLFAPLGISPAPWLHDPQGHTIGAFGLSIRARDLAKLGLLYLRMGEWEDRSILPGSFVRSATTRHSEGGDPEDAAYGYHWWVTSETGHAAFFAAGYGGQYLYVLPDLDLIVVTTAEWRLPPEDTPELRPLIEESIVQAVIAP